MEYANDAATWPFTFNVIGAPGTVAVPSFTNCTVPVIGASVVFTRTTSVVHPPPSAKWAMPTALLEIVAGRGVTVWVITRKSPRSFTIVRRESTPTGTEVLKVNVPVKLGARKGDSLRNFAVWALPANTKLLRPKS